MTLPNLLRTARVSRLFRPYSVSHSTEKPADAPKPTGDGPPPKKDPFAPFPNDTNPETGEVGGPTGPEPTRYGDWERKGNGNLLGLRNMSGKSDEALLKKKPRAKKVSTKAKNEETSSTSNNNAKKNKLEHVDSSLVPLIPVNMPFFPNFNQVLAIHNPSLSRLITSSYTNGNFHVGCFLHRNFDSDYSTVTTLEEIFHVGILANIRSIVSNFDESIRIQCTGIKRITFGVDFLKKHNVDAIDLSMTSNYEDKPPPTSTSNEQIDSDNVDENFFNQVFNIKTSNIVVPTQDFFNKTNATFNTNSENTEITTCNYVDYPYLYHEKDQAQCEAISLNILHTLEEMIGINSPLLKVVIGQRNRLPMTVNDFITIADTAAAFSKSRPLQLQQIIQEESIVKRLELALYTIKRELEIMKIMQNISKKVDEKISNMNRRAILMEYYNTIQQELTGKSGPQNPAANQSAPNFNATGNKTYKRNPADKFRARLDARTEPLPKYVADTITEEMEKLASIDSHSAEYSTVVNYLDLLTSLPWNQFSQDNHDLTKAREQLDRDHYGIKNVKDAIIEFMAVAIQSQRIKGKILCFAGPPGVGKTSIARSIAAALNREYCRISVGGLDDVSEIKGHRRTYIGSMPGKLVQALRRSKTMNPVVLIDEIDKLASFSHRGDPASAMLEVLDPEQNTTFTDHYLDLPIDLSKVLFLCTANDTSRISRPLLDRMELINIGSYVNEEKMFIAKNFIIPKIIEDFGVDPEKVQITDPAMEKLIDSYSREPGMRSMKKSIEKAYRKASVRLQTDEQTNKIVIEPTNLKEFVGAPSFANEKYFEETPVGVVCGLAYTELGGKVLYIESVDLKGAQNLNVNEKDKEGKKSGGVIITGSLGDVMKESVQIAKSVAESFLNNTLNKNSDYFETNKLHCHFPEGAVPKDGPSAGITIVTSLLSLALNKPVKKDLAMTGEICLSEKVLAVGGLKEKLLSAVRSKIKTVLVPAANKDEIEELPESIRDKLDIVYVATYDDVYREAFAAEQKLEKEPAALS